MTVILRFSRFVDRGRADVSVIDKGVIEGRRGLTGVARSKFRNSKFKRGLYEKYSCVYSVDRCSSAVEKRIFPVSFPNSRFYYT